MTRLPTAILVVWLLILSADCKAENETFERFDVSLVTIGPGQIYWQRFGHNAILIRANDSSDDPGVMYNYGLFDFQQKDFFLNFMRGHMTYKIAAFYADQDLASYVTDDRDVTIQQLNLTPSQKQELINFLEWNRRPENAAYRYDYFRSNCSTKIRDVLDTTLGGILKNRFTQQAANQMLRAHVQRLTSPDLALYLGTGLGLGQPVDQPISRWDEFFLPMELLHGLDQVVLPDGGKLVRNKTVVHRSLTLEPESAPHWLPGFLLSGLLLVSMLYFTRVSQALFRRTAGAWYLLSGFAGLVLALLWLLTDHQAAWYNENLLLFSPLGLLAAGPLLFGRITRFAVACAALAAAIAVLGLIFKLSPWLLQANLEFVAAVLPVHLICAGLLSWDLRSVANHDE